MNRIFLEAEKMKTEAEAQQYIKDKFGYGSDYDGSMDSFYSRLMSVKEPVEIELDESDLLADNLGRYGLGLIKLMRDASRESEYIDFIW